MSDSDIPARAAEEYWRAMEARDWAALGTTLADDVCYEVPQSRERVRGREACVRFNREFPGDWHLSVVRVVGSGAHAASWISFDLAGEAVPGLTFFDLDETGRIAHITDFWPEPYAPPASRAHLVERY